MALTDKILVASKKLHQDTKGMTGSISYLIPEASIFDPSLPVPGAVWPGPQDLPFLRCIEANWTEAQSGYWSIEYNYSTERQLGDEFAEVSSDWSAELVDNTRGFTWKTAGNKVDISIPTPVPLTDYTMKMRLTSPPYDAIAAAIQHVNDRVFRGFAAGCLRFDGASTSESYTIDGEMLSCQTTYKFTARAIDWNYAWRPPVIARDGTGKERYYQGADASAPDYSTANDGQPVYVAGTPGTGGWDRPKNGVDPVTGLDIYRYASCDFASVLGLPKLVGDG